MEVPKDTRLERFDWQVMESLRDELIAAGILLHFHEYPEWRSWWAERCKQIDLECPPTDGDIRQRQRYFDNPGTPGIALNEFWWIRLDDGELRVMVEVNEDPTSFEQRDTRLVELTHFRVLLCDPDSLERLIRWLQRELPLARCCPDIREYDFFDLLELAIEKT